MGIHLLHCAHSNESTRTHDVVRDTFVAIVRDVGFHVWCEQLHVLPSTHSTPLVNESTLCSRKMAFAF
jgi:hypothetical protein